VRASFERRGKKMPQPTWFEWLTVAAIVLGPVFALFAQRALDSIREKRRRRADVYLTLMATRATPVAQEHLKALNSIDIVFSGRRDRKVREAWHKVLEHVVTDTSRPGWQEKYGDLKADLLREIGLEVGYTFTTDELKRQIYHPSYYGELESDQLLIRKALAKALTDEGLKVKLVTPQEPQH
jgi:hypothetical protein